MEQLCENLIKDLFSDAIYEYNNYNKSTNLNISHDNNDNHVCEHCQFIINQQKDFYEDKIKKLTLKVDDLEKEVQQIKNLFKNFGDLFKNYK